MLFRSELEEEIKKMEAENAAKKAEVDELQKKIAEVQEAARGKDVSNLDAAFVSRPRTTINSEDRSLNLQEETVFVEDPKIGQTATGQAHEVDGKPQEEPEPIVEESNTAGLESPEATKMKENGQRYAKGVRQNGKGDRRGPPHTFKFLGLVEALAEFGVEAEMVDAVSGPRVTRYELRLAPGTKVSKVSNLRDEIGRAHV